MFCLLDLWNSRQSNWPILCFIQSRWDCSSIFLNNTAFSFFLLFVAVECLDKSFLYLIFAQSRKILSKFSNLSAVFKHRGQNFLMMASIVHKNVIASSDDYVYAKRLRREYRLNFGVPLLNFFCHLNIEWQRVIVALLWRQVCACIISLEVLVFCC